MRRQPATAAMPSKDIYFNPPEPLIKRIGRVSFSSADVAAAEDVVGEIAADMSQLIPQGVEKLRSIWDVRGGRLSPETVKGCRATAHVLAGYGSTLGYPMVTTLARSLCRFIEVSDLYHAGAAEIVDAHVAALHVVVRDKLTADGGPIGKALVDELARAVAKFRPR